MPDLTARITEILVAHKPEAESLVIGGHAPRYRCTCRQMPFARFTLTLGEHHSHVAALIAEAAEQHYRPRIETVDLTDGEFIAAARTLVPELLAEVERLRGCPHDSWSGDGTGRWRCDECDADQGSQDVGEVRRQLVDARAEVERLRGALDECVTFWRERYSEAAPHEYGDYNTALWDCICNIEAVLRGDQGYDPDRSTLVGEIDGVHVRECWDQCYSEYDVIRALVAEVRRLRGDQ